VHGDEWHPYNFPSLGGRGQGRGRRFYELDAPPYGRGNSLWTAMIV